MAVVSTNDDIEGVSTDMCSTNNVLCQPTIISHLNKFTSITITLVIKVKIQVTCNDDLFRNVHRIVKEIQPFLEETCCFLSVLLRDAEGR